MYLSSISTLNLSILIPLGIGLVIGGIFFMKITKYLLEHYRNVTFFGIIGFTIGSILVLFPRCSNIFESCLILFCVLLGYLISSFFVEKEKN